MRISTCFYLSTAVAFIVGVHLIATPSSRAAEISVPGDYATIQAALDAALAGDTVRVGPGIYKENLDFKQKDIELIGTAGAEATIIDAALSTGVKIGPGGSITGFTIKNARASFGAGMEVRGANSYIAFNIFEDNMQGAGGYGAAIGMNASSPVIEGNIFRRNSADSQFFSGVVSMINSSSPYIANNIFYDNSCRAINVTVPTSAAPVVVNNTMVRNTVGVRVDRRVNSINQVFRNNIIVDNGIGLEVDFGVEANNPVWENNLVFNNGIDYEVISNLTGTNGNISVDPLFVDAPNNNFRLLRGSPAVDAGTNMSAPAEDFEHEARPVDGNGDSVAVVDIGADELAFGINLLVEGGNVQECQSPQGNTVQVSGVAFPAGVQLASVELFLNGKSVAKSLPAQVTLPPGSNFLEVLAVTTDGLSIEGERTVEIVDTHAPEIKASFVDQRTGMEIATIDSNALSFVVVKIDVHDACDANPVVESVLGTEVEDGDQLSIQGNLHRLTLNADKICLKVTATDASGNVSMMTPYLTLTGKGK